MDDDNATAPETDAETPAAAEVEVEVEAVAETDAAPAAEAEVEAEAVAEAEPAAEAEADAAPVAAAAVVEDIAEEDFAGEAAEVYEAEPVAVAVAEGPSVARVYICKHGHRTVSLWSIPETCLRRVKGHVCGEAVVPLADAPADAKEKMLNPLKASKKAAKKT
ncbi:MAG: hypothetical protein CK540_00980 [Thermoleophilia bacterium]|nr:MAG: hypothetical protein CK540_00980 [Thermoleophilia bacterium]